MRDALRVDHSLFDPSELLVDRRLRPLLENLGWFGPPLFRFLGALLRAPVCSLRIR
jgi:hypothetical protein